MSRSLLSPARVGLCKYNGRVRSANQWIVKLSKASSSSTSNATAKDEIHDNISTMKDLPGPGLTGTFIHMKRGFVKMHETHHEFALKYGPMFVDKLFGRASVVISDPVLAGIVYRAESKWPYRSFDIVRELVDLKNKLNLPPSLLDLQGEEWGKLRKIIASKLLPPVKLKYYYEDFSLVANDAIEVMNVCRNSDGVVEDARDIIERWSMESIGMFAFGQRTGMLDDPPSDKGIKFRDTIKNVLSLSMFFSIFKWSKYFYRSKHKLLADSLTGYTQHAEHLVRNVIKHVLDCEERDVPIDRRYAKSFVYYLMAEDSMTEKECFVHAIDVYFAGLDTTSVTLGWLWYHLGMNPEKQDKLAAEIAEMVPADNVVTAAIVQKMPYLRACIKESSRLTPAATSIGRILEQDLILKDVFLPKETSVLLNNFTMGRDEKMFPNPEQFEPERWMRDAKEKSDINSFASQPFGYGARSCVGKRISEAELQVFTCLMVKRFRLEYIGKPQTGEIKPILTPKEPLRFAFHER